MPAAAADAAAKRNGGDIITGEVKLLAAAGPRAPGDMSIIGASLSSIGFVEVVVVTARGTFVAENVMFSFV